jgi:3-deoxy-D-manno-octulosonic-acid transferase
MWKCLYNIAVHVALPFFSLFALFNRKVRKNLGERLIPKGFEKGLRDRVWIHAASLGESAIAQNLIEQIGLGVPQPRFLVTTNTYYARDLLKRKLDQDVIVRSLPLDLPFSISRFIRGSTFRGLILIETELWPNLIWKANQRGIPIIIVNGRISDRTIHRYRTVLPLLKRVFAGVHLVLAQSERHAHRFIELGMDPRKVIVTGNLKYFRKMPTLPEKQKRHDIMTFGSIKEREVKAVIDVSTELKKVYPRLLIFIVPRELHLVNTIEEALRGRLTTMRYSILKERNNGYDALDTVVVDTVGDLMDIYGESRVAFVGGSLAPYGGQNMLEPLFFETPVLFGPYVENFKEVAEQIVTAGGGILVNSPKELLQQVTFLLGNEQARTRMGKAGRGIIDLQNRGMVDTVKRIREALWKDCSWSL